MSTLYVVHQASVTKIDLDSFTETETVNLSTVVGEDGSSSAQMQLEAAPVVTGQPYIKRLGGVRYTRFNQGVW